MGLNHILQSRVGNRDLALASLADIRNGLIEKGCEKIQCLGLFRGSYKQGSVVKPVAHKNVATVMEALSIFGYSIEIYEVGYRQQFSLLLSEARKSFLVKHINLDGNSVNILEVPVKSSSVLNSIFIDRNRLSVFM
jgi:hypothetical protein